MWFKKSAKRYENRKDGESNAINVSLLKKIMNKFANTNTTISYLLTL